MPNTFTQLYLHLVFATKCRMRFIHEENRIHLYEYMAGILNHHQQKPMIINGMEDHIHILLGFKPDCNISDLVRDLKSVSSKHINDNQWIAGKFAWQSGYGGFTVSRSQRDSVYHYIENQEKHHEHKSFRQEFLELLEAHGITYDEKYVFEKIE